ncbi:unnamed protein product [Meloidogyne enterolobii]|uniref:Uncharacterized protein n=1 Tax=Meloidogyne enterolobii TaxID=390850 RepID=A0ACB1AVX9_MELEN
MNSNSDKLTQTNMTENTSLTSLESGFVSLNELKTKEQMAVENAEIFAKIGKIVNYFKELGEKINLMAKKSWQGTTTCLSSVCTKNWLTNNFLLIMFVLLLVTLFADLSTYSIINYMYIKSDKEPDLFLVILHASMSFYLVFFPVLLIYSFVFKLISSVRPSIDSKWFLIISKIIPNLFVSILLSFLFIIMICFYYGFLSHIFDDMDAIIILKIYLFSLHWILFFSFSFSTYLINLPTRQGNTLVV